MHGRNSGRLSLSEWMQSLWISIFSQGYNMWLWISHNHCSLALKRLSRISNVPLLKALQKILFSSSFQILFQKHDLILILGLEVFLYNIFWRHLVGKWVNFILNLNLKLDILSRCRMKWRLSLVFLGYLFLLMQKIY